MTRRLPAIKIQRIRVVIEAGRDEKHLMLYATQPSTEDIDTDSHYRDKVAIVAAVRRLADRIEANTSWPDRVDAWWERDERSGP